MLGPIAKRFNVSVKAIEAANPGIDPNRLKVDHAITIPASTATPATAPATRPGIVPSTPSLPAPVATTAKPGASYKVKKGDTLVTISRIAYGNDKNWQRIFQANHSAIPDPNVVPVGLVIKIPQ